MITARLVSGATARSSGISQPQPTGGLHARPGHEMDLPASPRLSRKAKPSSHSASPPWRGRRGRSSARTRAGCRSWPCLVRPWGERVPGLRHRSLHCLFRNVRTGRGPISSRPFSVTRPRSRRERRSLAEGGHADAVAAQLVASRSSGPSRSCTPAEASPRRRRLDHEQPRYVDRDGVHCCGPCDCRRQHATKLRETQAGIATTTDAGDIILMPRARVAQGLDPSIDYN